ncbi:putative respiratory burst oxidase protein [Ectocarpus siliculosus]|uniref:Respiratory burst oxidase protein n=1 Tax=Ectocarpus siliculosus TaxID=2880 RepID=D7G8C8_ECTSI|nr:putative respiratory burst oxidase protein [Ectocarpus siliculosus]|eukprot:CBJ27980.1 putative respiratory burst oxidase protein [Ectocarpus siliculosus]
MFLPDRRASNTDDLEMGNHTRSPSLESGSAHDGSSFSSSRYGKNNRGGDGRARHHRTPSSAGNVESTRRERSTRRATDGDGSGRGAPGHGRRRSGSHGSRGSRGGGGGGGVGGGSRSSSRSSSPDGGDRSGQKHRRGGDGSGSSRARTLGADTDNDAGGLLEGSSYSGMSGMVVVDRNNNDRGASSRNIGGAGKSASGRSVGGGGGLGADGGGSGMGGGGQEPAVQRNGCMKTSTALKLITLAIALLNVVALWGWHYDTRAGRLCSIRSRRACVSSGPEMALISVARLTAGALFPSIFFCVLSKCYATRYLLHHSWLTFIIDFEPSHKLHTYFGVLILLCSVVHSVCHIAVGALQRRADHAFKDEINRSGLVAVLLLLPIALPMTMRLAKTKLTFEARKYLHLLFIPFMIAVCFHGRALQILGAILLAWYLLDRLYFTTKMTFLLSSPVYKPVGRGTLVRFELPPGYQYKPGAYVQVNCPAISVSEWHPFSLFPVPGSRPRAGFHVEAVGDWTNEMFRFCLENPQMPLWITAAQPSVVEKTMYFDNEPSISEAIELEPVFQKKKNIHLLWCCRDAGMVAMFEKQLRRVKSTVYLTGKPTNKTKKRMVDLLAPSRSDVVAANAGTSTSRSSSLRGDPACALEDGRGGGGGGGGPEVSNLNADLDDYLGVLKDDFEGSGRTERGSLDRDDDGGDGSVMGYSAWGGDSILGGGEGSALGVSSAHGGSALGGMGRTEAAAARREEEEERTAASKKRHRGQPSAGQLQRARGYHPVSLNFGRPDIAAFITGTVRGTAVVAQWAPPVDSRPPAPSSSSPRQQPTAGGLRQMLTRLNTGQRISKRDLMEADLTVVDSSLAKSKKPSSVSGVTGFDMPNSDIPNNGSVGCVDEKSWLVLYCGANGKVEQAVQTASEGLNVAWRKEYFSKW